MSFPSSSNRRFGDRVPLDIFVNEYVNDRPMRALTVNISPSGLFAHKVMTSMSRSSRVVGLEFELPGTGEVIWARGEVLHDVLDDGLHGQGIRFSGIPRVWRRMISDFCAELRRVASGGVPV